MRKALFFVVAIAVLSAGCTGVHETLTGELEKLGAAAETPEPSARPLPEPSARPYADFAAENLEGEEVSLSSLIEGRPAVVNFWASWCGPCAIEMPYFLDTQEEYRDAGLAVVMVNLTDGQRETAEIANAFLEDNGYAFDNVLYDTAGAGAASYVGMGIPVTVMVDEAGQVVYYREGSLDARTLSEAVAELMPGGE